MRLASVVILINALAWTSIVKAHEPGQEFTYLSMFQKPASPYGFSDRERETLSSQYIRKHSITTETRRQRLRRLQSDNQNQANEEVLDADDEALSQSDGDGSAAEKQTEDRAENDDAESEKPDVNIEEVLGDTKTEEIEVSTGSNNEEVSDSSQDDSEQQSVKVKVPRQVVHIMEDSTNNEAEKGDSSSARGRDSKSVKNSVTKNLRKAVSRSAKGSISRGQENMGSKDPDVSEMTKEGQRNGEDLKRLSMMLMKIIKQYKIKSLVDVPCRAHSHWMPIFLRHIAQSNTKKPFKYYCVDTNKAILKLVKERIDPDINAKFILRRFWKESLPPADLVFSWAGLDNMKEENVLKYVERLAVSKHKFVLLGSHSGQLEADGSAEKVSRFTLGGKPINLRKEPFKLAKPMRIVGDLSTNGNDKQLYVYKPKEMIEVE